MTRLLLLIVFAFMISMDIFSQESIFILHPAVGDTIDQKEKKDFLLFPEIKNKDFNYGVIYTSADKTFVNLMLMNDSLITRPISQMEIDQIRVAIDKLQAYYLNEAQTDSMKASNKKRERSDSNDLSSDQTIKIVIDQEIIKRAAIDGNRKQHLKQNGIDAGLRGQDLKDYQSLGGYGEIRFKKKSKK